MRSKAAAREAAGPLVSSGLAGMAAYFLASTLRNLRPRDAVCMILPGSWMHARYGQGIREYLWRLTHRSVRLEVFPHDVDVFPRAKVAAVVLFVGPEVREPTHLTIVQASITSGSVTTAREKHIDRRLEQPSTFPRSPLEFKSNGKYAKKLGESFAVHRGVATGRNAFFLLSDEEVEQHGLPATVLMPVIGSLRGVEDETLDEAAFERLGSRGKKRGSWWSNQATSRSRRFARTLATVPVGCGRRIPRQTANALVCSSGSPDRPIATATDDKA